MPSVCAVPGCKSNGKKHPGLKFFCFPKTSEIPAQKTITAERRETWFKIIEIPDSKKDLRICALHFITGFPSKNFEKDNPDWAPTQNMEYNVSSFEPVKDYRHHVSITLNKPVNFKDLQNHGTQKCFICAKLYNSYYKNLYELAHTKTPFRKYLEKFLGHDLNNYLSTTEQILCKDCMHKIDEYDFAINTAKQVGKELTDMLEQRNLSLKPFKFEYVEYDEHILKNEAISDTEEKQDLNTIDLDLTHNSLGNSQHLSAVAIGEDWDPNKDNSHKIIEETPYKINVQCKRCNIEFVSTIDLQEHYKKLHKSYRCAICKNKFKGQEEHNVHTKKHERKSLQCVKCGKNLKSKFSLIRHLSDSHTDDMLHQCEYCGKVFKDRSSLKIHLARYTKIKPKDDMYVASFKRQFKPEFSVAMK